MHTRPGSHTAQAIPSLASIPLALALVLGLGCGESTKPDDHTPDVVPKGSRVLSLDVQPAEDGDYAAALDLARRAGVQAVTFSVDWSTVEPDSGEFDFSNADIANAYYPAEGIRVGLSVRPISTTYRPLPRDLSGLQIDHPRVVRRFESLLDSLAAHLDAVTLNGVYIGSEHDVYLGESEQEWDHWQSFYDVVRLHAESLWPTVPIGTEFTYEGLTGASAAHTRRSNETSDVVVVSYYPLGPGFQVLAPSEVLHAFDTIAGLYPGRVFHVNQIGYPSSAANGSTEEKQRQFVAETFAAWDKHAARIAVLNFDWQTELTAEEVSEFEKLYGLHDPAFAAFLGSLGFRHAEGAGRDKPAFGELGRQAHARGW